MTKPQIGENMKELTDIYFGFEYTLIPMGYTGSEVGYLWAEYAERHLSGLLERARNEC